MVLGNDAVVIRELAFHQFGHKLHAAKAELGLVVGKLHVDRAFGIAQQALQLQHRLARQDHLLPGYFDVQRGRGKGQAMAVSGDQAELLALGHKQNAIQVVADIVHRHGKRHLAQQVFQCFLWHAEHRAKSGGLLHQREILCRQGLQRELAFAALEDDLAGVRFERYSLVGRHGAQNVDQLARAHGGGEVAGVALQLGRGADLDLQITGGELQRGACFANQDVGQDGQRVPPLHNASDRLQSR